MGVERSSIKSEGFNDGCKGGGYRFMKLMK